MLKIKHVKAWFKNRMQLKTFLSRKKVTNQSLMEKSQNIASGNSEGVVPTQVPSTHTQDTIPFTFQDGGKLNGYSDHSLIFSVTAFRAMFPDSIIASMIHVGKNK